jgi:hypothetical protein
VSLTPLRRLRGVIDTAHCCQPAKNSKKYNSKPALEKNGWPGKKGGRLAAVFGKKRVENRLENFFIKKYMYFFYRKAQLL